MKSISTKFAAAVLITSIAINAHAALENQVKNSPTPYLAMHGTDPVHWQQWNAETLQRARAENKPLFFSIGFFACYWCHVMQRESFRDADIARILNSKFIPVIVDRELEPELDAQLLEFVERYRGSAGWPLNVVVTPEGYPVLGGVYFPRQELRTVLERLAESWTSRSDELSRVARQAAASAAPEPRVSPPGADISPEALMRRFVEQSLRFADRLSGGFGEQSKFPMSAQLLALIRAYETARDPVLGEFLRNTLAAMAALGLRDHLTGGFFRYTTDPAWRTPHFEKMLYDQALVSLVFLRGARALERPEFASVARETLDFALANLRDASGMFHSSLSAVDDRGDEGAYYLWDPATLKSTLVDDELPVVRAYYGLRDTPGFDHGDLLIPALSIEDTAKALRDDPARVRTILDRAQGKLRAERARRTLPVDAKRIAAWNGLMLMALTEAAALPDSKRHADAARDLRNALATTAWRDQTLYRNLSDTRGTLEDYAYVASGLAAYARRFQSNEDYVLARSVVAHAWMRFYRDGVWSFSEHSLLPPRNGRAAFEDGALPSATALLLGASLDIASRLDDKKLAAAARDALARARGMAADDPFNHASHVALERDQPPGTGR